MVGSLVCHTFLKGGKLPFHTPIGELVSFHSFSCSFTNFSHYFPLLHLMLHLLFMIRSKQHLILLAFFSFFSPPSSLLFLLSSFSFFYPPSPLLLLLYSFFSLSSPLLLLFSFFSNFIFSSSSFFSQPPPPSPRLLSVRRRCRMVLARLRWWWCTSGLLCFRLQLGMISRTLAVRWFEEGKRGRTGAWM